MRAVPATKATPSGREPETPTVFDRAPDAPAVLVTAVGAAEGARGAAAALACAGADPDRAPLLIELGGRPPRPTLLASTAARALEDRLAAHLPRTRVAARGQVCQLAVPCDADGFAAAAAAATVARGSLAVLLTPPGAMQELLAAPAPRPSAVLLRADLADDRALLALVVRDLRRRGLATGVLKHRLGWVEERRALFGVLGEQGGIPPRLRDRLLRDGCYLADNEFQEGQEDDEAEEAGPEPEQRASSESWRVA
jgi:hypothetical protein